MDDDSWREPANWRGAPRSGGPAQAGDRYPDSGFGGYPQPASYGPGARDEGAEGYREGRDPGAGPPRQDRDGAWTPRGARPDPWGSGVPSRESQDDYRAAPSGSATRRSRAAASPSGGVPEGRRNMDIDLDEVDPKGHARRAAAARSGRGRPASRRKKALKWASLSMAGVLLAVLGVGAYLYVHFNGNLKTSSLLPDGVTQAAEIPNKFGQTAMSILLLGNGGRVNATDCKLGGACADTATDADTLMVVHLAADRSNMTVMSIPRDTVVNLPTCAHDATDLINASLVNGPACAVQTVHDVTGLTIDHFIEVDMSGVVTMSNALGGVPVCVTNNLYDSYSHLKLPKGTSVLQGTQALAWVRTRHAFLNEVYREQAQHMFMSALLRKMEANASLTHVSTLYSVADAATKSLTVDSGLGSVLDLLSLAQEIGKVPTSRVTMLSAPTVAYTGPNPAWSQQLQFDPAAAPAMFAALKADTPYTKPVAKAAKPAAAPSTAPAPATTAAAVNKAQVRVAVQNATGVNGRAAAIKTALASDGFTGSLISAATAATADTTALYYPSTRSDSAAAVASALGIPPSATHESANYSQVTLVIGKDWTSGTTYGTASSSGTSSTATTTGPTAPSTAVASSPPTSSLLTNGADSNACMYVPQPEW